MFGGADSWIQVLKYLHLNYTFLNNSLTHFFASSGINVDSTITAFANIILKRFEKFLGIFS